MTQSRSTPAISRSVRLDLGGDWGQANFHRILSWITQEFCDRAGPLSKTRIHSIVGGGLASMYDVASGDLDLCIATPNRLLPAMRTGSGIFEGGPDMRGMRALAVLPQVDRMVLAIAPRHGIHSIEDLRRKKPPIRLAISHNTDGNFIGYVGDKYLAAHGLSEAMIREWGGECIRAHRPDACLALVQQGLADAVLQEAIMTPWWRDLIESGVVTPISAEPEALAKMAAEMGLPAQTIAPGYWKGQTEPIHSVDFSDFLIMVREDMSEDVAYLLTWCFVETRSVIEAQYRHIPPERSPLSYPLDPVAMSQPSLPLHPGALRYYREAGILS